MNDEETFSATRLNGYNPLWKAQAWCRRNEGYYFLYVDKKGNTDISKIEKPLIGYSSTSHEELLEIWRNGMRIYRDPRRPETLAG